MAKKNETKPVAKTTEAPVQNPEEITPENVYEKIDEQTTASLEAAKLAFEKMSEAKTKVEAEEIKEVVYQAQWVNLKSICGMRKYRAYSKLMKEFADKTKEFAEKVFEAYTNVIVEALEARMKACANNLIKHTDDIKYCDDKYITYVRKSGGEHTFSFNAYETMRGLVSKIQQYKLGELTKFELKQIAKALYWVEDKSDIGKYTFLSIIQI